MNLYRYTKYEFDGPPPVCELDLIGANGWAVVGITQDYTGSCHVYFGKRIEEATDEQPIGVPPAPTCDGCGRPMQQERPDSWRCPDERHCSKCGESYHGEGEHECEFDGGGEG